MWWTLSLSKVMLPFLLFGGDPMKCKVKLYVAGKVFYEEVQARNYQDAKQTALARNPTAKIISVNAVFD